MALNINTLEELESYEFIPDLPEEVIRELEADLADLLSEEPIGEVPEAKARSFVYDTSIDSTNVTKDSADPTSITIHWWGEPRNHRSGEGLGIARWLAGANGSKVSAHYVGTVNTSSGQEYVWQLVADRDGAWHAGLRTANLNSIGIEMMPFDSSTPTWQVNALLNLTAKIVASLWHRWPALRGKQLIGHQEWKGTTACPGNYQPQLRNIEALASYWYERYAGSFGQFDEDDAPTPEPAPTLPGTLAVDGKWGPATSRETNGRIGQTAPSMANMGKMSITDLQSYYKRRYPNLPMTVDGYVSGQTESNRLIAWTQSLVRLGGQGSQLIRAMATDLEARGYDTNGTVRDGRAGPAFVRAHQLALNGQPDYLE